MINKSVEFSWDSKDIEKYVIAKQKLEECQESIKIASRLKQELQYDPKILEAGSGNGCVVIIFDRLGFKNIKGIELNKNIVEYLNRAYPHLNITCGSILYLGEHLKNNDFVMSLGVVEHFIDGPSKPIKAVYEAVKNGGYALISVPCLNFFRKVKKLFDNKTKKIMKESSTNFVYHPWFLQGQFHEYHMTTKEFRRECEEAGFIVEKQLPGEIDLGIMHLLNPKNKKGKFIWYEELEEYQYSLLGRMIYNFAKRMPFLFCHFQICVLRKKV